MHCKVRSDAWKATDLFTGIMHEKIDILHENQLELKIVF